MKNLKHYLLALLFLSQLSVTTTIIKADETVPAQNIEQFVDVFKRIKEQYVEEIDDEQLF